MESWFPRRPAKIEVLFIFWFSFKNIFIRSVCCIHIQYPGRSPADGLARVLTAIPAQSVVRLPRRFFREGSESFRRAPHAGLDLHPPRCVWLLRTQEKRVEPRSADLPVSLRGPSGFSGESLDILVEGPTGTYYRNMYTSSAGEPLLLFGGHVAS